MQCTQMIWVFSLQDTFTIQAWPNAHFFRRTYFNVNNPKFGPFLRASEVLEGLKSREEKKIHTTTPSFSGQKLKWAVIMEFLSFDEVLKYSIFFSVTYLHFYLCVLKKQIFMTSEALQIFWGPTEILDSLSLSMH